MNTPSNGFTLDEPGNYPLNNWYVAASSGEIGHTLLARELLGQPVLLYRRSSGTWLRSAMSVRTALCRCRTGNSTATAWSAGITDSPSRPMGSVSGCRRRRTCPSGPRVQVYTVREEPPVVWIWMGDPARPSRKRHRPCRGCTRTDGPLRGPVAHRRQLPGVARQLVGLHASALCAQGAVPARLRVAAAAAGHRGLGVLGLLSAGVPGRPAAAMAAHRDRVETRRASTRSANPESSCPPACTSSTWTFRCPIPTTTVQTCIEGRGSAGSHRRIRTARTSSIGSPGTIDRDRPEVTEHLRGVHERLLREDKKVLETMQSHAARYGERTDLALVNADVAAMKAHEIVSTMLVRERARSTQHSPPVRRTRAR